VWIGLNIEHFEVDRPGPSISPTTTGLKPDALNYGWRDYGVRVGLWRLVDVLDRYRMKASVLLHSNVCTRYPEIIEEGNKREWVWLAHGKTNGALKSDMDIADERTELGEMVRAIRDATGQQPKGWLGPALSETFNTPRVLAELGLTYTCDWCADDQPFPMKVEGHRFISVPYSMEVNDIPLFMGRGLSGPDFYQLLVDQFDGLYADSAAGGRVLCIALHPFVIGQPFRLKYLDLALAHISSHQDVWLTTSDDIADWYYERYYEAAARA
jgi:peptidoglycan/xylan/chitin deacetylase (PgdA/CDA1 family)